MFIFLFTKYSQFQQKYFSRLKVNFGLHSLCLRLRFMLEAAGACIKWGGSVEAKWDRQRNILPPQLQCYCVFISRALTIKHWKDIKMHLYALQRIGKMEKWKWRPEFSWMGSDFLSDWTAICQRVCSAFARDWPDTLHLQDRWGLTRRIRY